LKTEAGKAVSFIAFSVSRRIVRGAVHKWFERFRFTWDDRLQKNKLFMRVTLIVPALINDSFKNWRGMQESQGRRIKRAIHIDMNAIKY
jgi:hypothetical protein